MARTGFLKHIRKAGAFTAGQLTAGEIGVNTTDKRLAFSTDGSDLNIVPKIVSLTQAQYDALGTKDANTLYAITG